MPLDPVPKRVPSVCLVACYFGKFPGWINVLLLSCAHNPTIDFIILTDQDAVPKAPQNVRFVRLLPSAFADFAAEKLGVAVNLSSSYKVCDFKPLYGLLFEDYLKGWDYWGYTDLDVVYGDIRRFLSMRGLESYDVFTARHEYLVGHFTLFRNNEPMRNLFRQSADIPALLSSERVYCFDECGKQCVRLLKGGPLSSDATCDSMTHVVRRLAGRGEIEAHFSTLAIEWPELRGRLWRLRWRGGRLWLVDERRECMYLHFHVFKYNSGYCQPQVCPGDDALEISAHGITGCLVEQLA